MSTIEKQQAELEKAIKIAEQSRKSSAKYNEKVKEDPELYADKLVKHREYNKLYYQRNREARQAKAREAYHKRKLKEYEG
jgi:hypothetical protein